VGGGAVAGVAVRALPFRPNFDDPIGYGNEVPGAVPHWSDCNAVTPPRGKKTIVDPGEGWCTYRRHESTILPKHRRAHQRVLYDGSAWTNRLRGQMPAVDTPHQKHLICIVQVIANLVGEKRVLRADWLLAMDQS
jgi:hypothetical protein